MQDGQIKKLLGALVIFILTACSNSGGISSNSDQNGGAGSTSLSVTAPDQYPAGVATTAYLTISNNSTASTNNLVYSVPSASNNTGAVISVNSDSANSCRNLSAAASCILKVNIDSNSHPGSFAVTATSANQTNATLISKIKSAIGLNSEAIVLKTNIGLTTIPTNTQTGANGISFLYSSTIAPESSGPTQLSVVAVVNQNAGSNFNTINLTTANGTPLDFSVLSGNSGSGLTNLSPGSIITFVLSIPAGASTPYSFYAQTMDNGTLVSQSNTANQINIGSSSKGVLTVQPTGFTFSASENYLTQIITYTNTGNATISNLSVQTPIAPISIIANDCQASLEVGRSCIVVLNSSATTGSSGSGSLVATYNGGSSVISQYNYSGATPTPTPVPQAGISLSAINNFSFSANTTNGHQSTQVTIVNMGNTSEANFTFNFNPNQYFSISRLGNDTCQVNNGTITSVLNVGESCTLTMSYDNSTFGAGLTTLTVNYDYNGSAQSSTTNTLAYQTTQAGATLNISPSSYNFGGIIANNSESKTQTFTLTNTGQVNITSITFQIMSGDSSFFSLDSSGSGGCSTATPLANGGSCTFKVKFGPTSTVKDIVSASLPIAYSFVGGSSSASLSLSGYSRTTTSANIELYNVSSSISIGNGESANSAYQVDASTAANSTIVLSYKNNGLTDASNFAISSAPNGYIIDNSSTCGSSITTLQANGANSCVVVIKPTTSTAGALNVNLSSSLAGSWTDEHGSVNSQTILWSTGNGTQNTIYVNIFASSQVTATMSSSSSGTPTITQVETGETFYIVLNLTGGYNVNTTYTISAPIGFTPRTSNCNITSSNPQCYVAITSPSVASTSNTVSIATSDGVTTTPASFTFNVVSPTIYAYLSTGTSGIFQCTVSEADGALTNCINGLNPNGISGTIVSLAISPTGNYLYTLTNIGTLATDVGSYYACNLGTTGQYESTNCGQKSFPAYGNIAFAPTLGTTYAYLAGQPAASNGNAPNYCTILQESSLFCNVRSNYPTQTSRTLSSMLVNDSSYVYISSVTDSKVYVCDVTNSAGYTGSNCPSASGATAIKTTTISNIKIGSDSYAYIINQSGGTELQYCKIIASGAGKGSFEGNTCTTADPSSYLSIVSNSTKIATTNINGQPYLYAFGDAAGSVSVCSISTTNETIGPNTFNKGELSGCVDYTITPNITTTVGSMAFGSF